jgi:hypothetical protein
VFYHGTWEIGLAVSKMSECSTHGGCIPSMLRLNASMADPQLQFASRSDIENHARGSAR